MDPPSAPTSLKPNVQFSIEDDGSSDTSIISPKQFPSIREEDELGEIILRPRLDVDGGSGGEGGSKGTGLNSINGSLSIHSTPIMNKRLRHVQSVPYFPLRPASENDIFSISGGSMNQISMTPEIPSISYSTLPKNYEDTPTIEKYKESVSLYSIQTANSAKIMDFSMPRYFRKSDIIAQSADNLRPKSMSEWNPVQAANSTKSVEKSKRLKMLRTNLPPLSIHIGGSRERSKDKGIE